jgi:hypothetical protein
MDIQRSFTAIPIAVLSYNSTSAPELHQNQCGLLGLPYWVLTENRDRSNIISATRRVADASADAS